MLKSGESQIKKGTFFGNTCTVYTGGCGVKPRSGQAVYIVFDKKLNWKPEVLTCDFDDDGQLPACSGAKLVVRILLDATVNDSTFKIGNVHDKSTKEKKAEMDELDSKTYKKVDDDEVQRLISAPLIE